MRTIIVLLFLSSFCIAEQVDQPNYDPTAIPVGTQFIFNIPAYGQNAGDTVTKQPEGYYRGDQDQNQYISTDAVEEDTTTFQMINQ